MNKVQRLTTMRKIVLVGLVIVEQLLQTIITKIATTHERVITSMLDIVFYRGTPGMVSFGHVGSTDDEEVADSRIDGYVYFRTRENALYKIPFRVQNLPRSAVWNVRYVRGITTAAMYEGLSVLWIERGDLIASATTALWQKKDPRFDAMRVICKPQPQPL